MGTGLIFPDRCQMRRGDGEAKVIRVLDYSVLRRGRLAGKSANGSSGSEVVLPRERSDWKLFQEKPLSFSLTGPYRKPTLVGELNMLRRLRELGRRNSAN